MLSLFKKNTKKKSNSVIDLYNLLVNTYGSQYQKIMTESSLEYHLFKGDKENVVVCFFNSSSDFIPTPWITNNHQRVNQLKQQGYKIDRLVFVSEGTYFDLDLFDLDQPKIKWKSLAKNSKEDILYDILKLTQT